LVITIIAFGDSLTVGYQTPTHAHNLPANTPYTDILKRGFKQLLQEEERQIEIIIINKGVCGDLTSDMTLRIKNDALDIDPDMVIILGGSNDIGWGISTTNIFENLRTMYNQVLRDKIELVTCAVPSILGYDALIPPRIALNKAIQGYSLEHGIPYADLFTATAEPKTNRLLKRYSNDGLHLNSDGYERIGEEISKTIRSTLLRICNSKKI